jgi:hypothetical protein
MGVCRLNTCPKRRQQQQVGTLERWRNALFHGHATASLGGPAPQPAGDATAAARVGTWVATGGNYHPPGSNLRHTSSTSSSGGGHPMQEPGRTTPVAGGVPPAAVAPAVGEAPGGTPSAPGDNLVCRKVCEDTPAGRVCTLECVVESEAEGQLGQPLGQPAGQTAAGVRPSSGSSSTGLTQVTRHGPQNLGEGVEQPTAAGSAAADPQQQHMVVPLSCRAEVAPTAPTAAGTNGELVKAPVNPLVKGGLTKPARYAPLGPQNLEQGSNKAAPIYPRLSLVFKDFTLLRGRCGTRIVSDVTGRYVHSKLHAVMGPSGCGKTSFCVGECPRAGAGGGWEGCVCNQGWQCALGQPGLGRPMG